MKKNSSRNYSQSSQESIEEIVDRILANGYLSPLEHLELTTIFLSDFLSPIANGGKSILSWTDCKWEG